MNCLEPHCFELHALGELWRAHNCLELDRSFCAKLEMVLTMSSDRIRRHD